MDIALISFVTRKHFLYNSFYFLLKLGPALPKALIGHSLVEILGDVFSVGGKYNQADFEVPQLSIYQLSCYSGICSWSTVNQQVKREHAYHVAIPVPFCPTTTTTTKTTTACADIWSTSKCKEKKKAGQCDTSCTTNDCVKTQAKCRKQCNIC